MFVGWWGAKPTYICNNLPWYPCYNWKDMAMDLIFNKLILISYFHNSWGAFSPSVFFYFKCCCFLQTRWNKKNDTNIQIYHLWFYKYPTNKPYRLKIKIHTRLYNLTDLSLFNLTAPGNDHFGANNWLVQLHTDWLFHPSYF